MLANPPPPSAVSSPTSPPGAAARDAAIDLHEVVKHYGRKVQALRGISMRVERGEIFGLLGPNGAGKSTLVKILMTVVRPTRCRGTMLGRVVGDKAALRRVGYLPEHHRFPEYLTARQVMDYFGGLADVPKADRRRRTGELLDLVGLSRWADTRVKGYSKGMRQRLGIAQSLVNSPDLVLLDEPTDGVDPIGRRDIRAILQEVKARGKTVFLNSHLLSELEMVSDRVAIMVQGKVWAQGTIDDLTAYGRRYEIEVPDLPTSGAARDLPGLAMGVLPSGERLEIEGPTIRVATDEMARVQPLIDAIRAKGLAIRAVRPMRPSLEDLFVRAVTDPTTGEVLAPGAIDLGRGSGKGGNGNNGGAR